MNDPIGGKTTVNVRDLTISRASSLLDAMRIIESQHIGIALVVDDLGRLLGTITDGDLRRGLLSGSRLEAPVHLLLERKADGPYASPLVASARADKAELLDYMKKWKVRQIPLVDDDGRPTAVVTMEMLVPATDLDLVAVLMAGGRGQRLGALTRNTPKPMLSIGGQPLLERVVRRLSAAGVREIFISIHYLADQIKEHFRDGRDFGVPIRYIEEDEPMGTAGCLSLMEPPRSAVLVMNGDILTGLDIAAMNDFHIRHEGLITMGVRQYQVPIPFGVIHCEDHRVQTIVEKPTMSYSVNAGIYMLQPDALELVPRRQRTDMPGLVERALSREMKVVAFPVLEYWTDIGNAGDYSQAQSDWEGGKIR